MNDNDAEGAAVSENQEREVVFWDCDETAEDLVHETFDGAIIARLGGSAPKPADLDTPLMVYGWARTIITPDDLPSPIDLIMDRLAEDEVGMFAPYGGREDKITDAMIEAEKAFLAVMAREFVPWACEIVEKRTVNVREWAAEHRPEWLRESK